MTSEQDEKVTDELVSKTYRELDSVQTPDHLNQSILRMAAGKKAGRNGFFVAAWMRPVTWAATIALSLAIVLELSDVPTAPVPVDVFPAAESKLESIREEITPLDNDAPEQLENRAQQPSAFERSSVAEEESPMPAALKPRARKRPSDQTAVGRTVVDRLDQPVARQKAAAEPVASSLAVFEDQKKLTDSNRACDDETRQTASAWLECIADLRESGAIVEADREFAALQQKYPDVAVDLEAN